MDDCTPLDLIKLGATILAMVHNEIINYDCKTCIHSEGLSNSLNCDLDENIDRPLFSHEDTPVLYACPIRYLTPDIYEYYDRYHYYKLFTGAQAPSYDDVDRAFWEFIKTYEYHSNKYQMEKINKDSNVNKEKQTGNNMAMLRKQFLNKDKK